MPWGLKPPTQCDLRPILSIELAAYGIERMVGFWQDLVRYWPLGGTRYLGRGQRDYCQIRVTDMIKCEPPGPWMEWPTSPARPNWATLQKGPSGLQKTLVWWKMHHVDFADDFA